MNESYVYFNGKIVKEEEASIGIRSKAFNYGLGCFEGIRAYWDEEEGQLYGFRLYEHYERLLNSCKTLSINIDYTVQDLVDITVELLKKNNFKSTTYIRPVAYKGSDQLSPTLMDDDDRLLVYCQPLGNFAGKESFKVCISSWRRMSDNMIPPRVKPTGGYINSALASLEALQNGYDEAIILTDSGNICEGPGENLFIVKKGKLMTPPPSDNILEGITRDTVMLLAKEEFGIEVEQRSFSRVDLYTADEAFFSGTAMEVTPVVEVDNRVIGNGEPGEICMRIKSKFFEITCGKVEKYRKFCTPVY